jgi:hypothetical protein
MPIAIRLPVGLLTVVLLAGSVLPALAGNGCGCETTCGCEAPRCFCHHHHCHRGCNSCQQPYPQQSRGLPPAPSGPIVESVPMMRMMPLMAAPMMLASYAPQTERALPREEATCQASSSRLAQLEERFVALQMRVDTLQSTLENQTAILQAIKTKLDAR